MKNKDTKLFFSAPEVAQILKVSRATIASRIRNGLIRAEKLGKNYIIPREEIIHLLEDTNLSEKNTKDVNDAVEKAIKEYGQAIRMLGKE